jgi:hypothetical protein
MTICLFLTGFAGSQFDFRNNYLKQKVIYSAESVIFCWLRNERGRKCFSHTLLGDWVKGGVKVIRVTFLLASC